MSCNFPEIHTSRLLLRQINNEDLDNVFRGLSHPDVTRYYGISIKSREGATGQMDWYKNLLDTGTGIWWAVCSPGNEIFYGAGGLNNLIRVHRKAEVGFWILPGFWGQGIMKEALQAICHYAFDNRNMHRLEGFVETENLQCKKAIEKLGFRHEGTMVDCEIKNRKFISLDVYALLQPTFSPFS